MNMNWLILGKKPQNLRCRWVWFKIIIWILFTLNYFFSLDWEVWIEHWSKPLQYGTVHLAMWQFFRTNWLDFGWNWQFKHLPSCHSLSSGTPDQTSSYAGGILNWPQHCTFNILASPQGKGIGHSLELSSMASSSQFNGCSLQISSPKSLILEKVIFVKIAVSRLKLINSFWFLYWTAHHMVKKYSLWLWTKFVH